MKELTIYLMRNAFYGTQQLLKYSHSQAFDLSDVERIRYDLKSLKKLGLKTKLTVLDEYESEKREGGYETVQLLKLEVLE